MPFDIGGFIFNGDRIENDARAGIVTDGLLLHLDAGISESYPKSGTTWYDLSGNGNNGTLVNGVEYSSDNNGSMKFDGDNDYINLGSSYLISTENPFTVNAFINLNPRVPNGTQSDFHRLITLRAAGTSTLGIAYVSQLNSGYEGLYITNNNGWVRGKTAYYPTPNIFGFLTLTYNGVSSTNITNFKMYWNLEELTFNTSGLATPSVTTDNNYLGIRRPDDIQRFNGNIAVFQVYDRALSTTEITQNFNAQRARFGV